MWQSPTNLLERFLTSRLKILTKKLATVCRWLSLYINVANDDADKVNAMNLIFISRTCLVRNLIVPLTPDAAMPLAQFADPWQKVQIKPDSEVMYYLAVSNFLATKFSQL